MPHEEDIAQIKAQEAELVFDGFDPDDALELGLKLRSLAAAQNKAVSIDVRLWDRQLFGFAMAGTTADNLEWMRRKVNVVKRLHAASYRILLECGGVEDAPMKPHWGLSSDDYVFAGGGFPINIKGMGAVGAITVSGLPGRDDHGLVVEALCWYLKRDHGALALA